MEIVIDTTAIERFFSQPALTIIKEIFFLGGWIPFAIIFLWVAYLLWLDYIQGKWLSQQKFVLLAIDIPRDNRQSPKAVENLFTYLAGAHSTFNLIETYWLGMFQLSFSFEIVSIEGYTQFLIWTPENFRDLVEAAIYSQYPDAEITAVEDYTTPVPSRYPDDDWDVWGAEFILSNKYVYPIKTYPEFEHPNELPEAQYKDPMASLMSLTSTLGKGEHFWLQMLITPTGFDWMADGDKEIKAILGEKDKPKKTIFDLIADGILNIINSIPDLLFGAVGGETSSSTAETEDEPLKMMNLKPKEKKQVEAIQRKISKIGFKTKIRMVYAARKEVINKPKVVNGFVGYIKQFADLDLNNLKPDMARTGTSASYFFVDSRLNARKTRIVTAYKLRSTWRGRLPFIMNIEELATLWHFPVEPVVRAPLLQKAPGRKGEPPMALPAEAEEKEIPLDDILFELEQGSAGQKAKRQGTAGRPTSPKPSAGLAGSGRQSQEEDIFAEIDKQQKPGQTDRPSAKPPTNLPLG